MVASCLDVLPDLGIHRALVDQSGSVLVNENQLKVLLSSACDEESIREGVATILGTAWDEELERFRGADLQELPRLHAI
jgi:hypothetical protein